jgi:hypothetical protein
MTQVRDQDGPPISYMPLTPSDNLLFLAEIRQRHQTKEAEKGIRLANRMALEGDGSPSPSGATENPLSERRLLAQKIRDIVKSVNGEKDASSSTGLNRQFRWTKTPGIYSPSLISSTQNERKTGNSANAFEAAQKAANLVSLPQVHLKVHAVIYKY